MVWGSEETQVPVGLPAGQLPVHMRGIERQDNPIPPVQHHDKGDERIGNPWGRADEGGKGSIPLRQQGKFPHVLFGFKETATYKGSGTTMQRKVCKMSAYRGQEEIEEMMGRLTTNKDASDMSMTQLAHNACYVKDGKARYRDRGMDIDARELARKLLKDYAAGDDAFTCDDDFDEYMAECLLRGTNDIEGLIALFYRNLWAMAEIHEWLRRYEDLGEQGRLAELPCAVGDTVYRINKGAKEPIIPMTVVEVGTLSLKTGGLAIQITCRDNADGGETCYVDTEFGKIVFFRREEAETYLKERAKKC